MTAIHPFFQALVQPQQPQRSRANLQCSATQHNIADVESWLLENGVAPPNCEIRTINFPGASRPLDRVVAKQALKSGEAAPGLRTMPLQCSRSCFGASADSSVGLGGGAEAFVNMLHILVLGG